MIPPSAPPSPAPQCAFSCQCPYGKSCYFADKFSQYGECKSNKSPCANGCDCGIHGTLSTVHVQQALSVQRGVYRWHLQEIVGNRREKAVTARIDVVLELAVGRARGRPEAAPRMRDLTSGSGSTRWRSPPAALRQPA